jgi:quinol monooxygenase YgiN
MSDQISWRVELAVKPGQLDRFQDLTREMVAATRQERGVLSYERFIADDPAVIHVYERYADSAAALAHLKHFRETFAERYSQLVDRTTFTVYGNPTDALKQVLDGFGAVYLRPFGDCEYWS